MINKDIKEINDAQLSEGIEAYETLVQWVKTAPKIIQDLEKNGKKEELHQYRLKIKLVLDKLKEIQKLMVSE